MVNEFQPKFESAELDEDQQKRIGALISFIDALTSHEKPSPVKQGTNPIRYQRRKISQHLLQPLAKNAERTHAMARKMKQAYQDMDPETRSLV